MPADHPELENSLAAFVLGAAGPEEAAAIQAHLETCQSCQAVARRLRTTRDLLPLAAEQVKPPDRLRSRILAAAGQGAARPPSRARILPLRPAVPRWLRGVPDLRGAVAAVAVVAFAAGAGLGIGLGRAATPPAPAPAVARYAMTGSGPLAAARGTAVDLRSQGLTFVQFSGLPQPAGGRVYELWLIDKGGRATAGPVFVPTTDGRSVIVLSQGVAGYKALAVTEEPGPAGSTQPTQQPNLQGTLT